MVALGFKFLALVHDADRPGDPLQPDPAAIRSFLADATPSAVHLVAIKEGAPNQWGRHFGMDAEAASAWAAERNRDGWNVHWTPNEVRPGVNKKPTKADITAARFVHVDIDPPKDGSPFDRDEVRERLTGLQHPPSFVIDSGNGLQAFWRLDRWPMENTDGSDRDRLEAVNRGAIAALGGDQNTANIDRLMRLPGTVNWPDRKKRDRGCVPALATILEPDEGEWHEFAALAAMFPAPVAVERTEREAVAAGPVQFLTADDLGLEPFDELRILIERPAGRDRSGDVLALAGHMVRQGYSDAQVMGVLLNPANAVHAHIADQANPFRAAARALGTAKKDEASRPSVVHGAAQSAALGFAAQPEGEPDASELDDVADWDGIDVPPQRWMLEGWFPTGEASFLTGAGAIGKSLVAQQLATCVAAGVPFMGTAVDPAPAIYLTCEDRRDELKRRQQNIAALLGINLADLRGRLKIACWHGTVDTELVRFDRNRKMELTDRFQRLRATALSMGARFIVLDNTGHLFGGDENIKSEVRPFCSVLNGLAAEIDGTVLLLGHPNKTGLTADATRGAQYGGSIAWENHVRSRAFMLGDEDDDNARVLVNPKANYSAKGGKIEFRWHQGAFARMHDLGTDAAREIAANIMATHDNDAFLACLAKTIEEKRATSSAPNASSYSPRVFSKMTIGRGVTLRRFQDAMERLFHLGTIANNVRLFQRENRAWVTGVGLAPTLAPTPAPTLHEPCTNPHGAKRENLHQPARTCVPISKDIEGLAPTDAASPEEEKKEAPRRTRKPVARSKPKASSRRAKP